ncbi:hypothetical protein YC2023_002522 [Brassica napus]
MNQPITKDEIKILQTKPQPVISERQRPSDNIDPNSIPFGSTFSFPITHRRKEHAMTQKPTSPKTNHRPATALIPKAPPSSDKPPSPATTVETQMTTKERLLEKREQGGPLTTRRGAPAEEDLRSRR